MLVKDEVIGQAIGMALAHGAILEALIASHPDHKALRAALTAAHEELRRRYVHGYAGRDIVGEQIDKEFGRLSHHVKA